MKKKYRNLIYVGIFILIIIGMIFAFIDLLRPDVPEVSEWYKYKVKSGDTLWDIVPEKSGYDLRDLIRVVKEYNNLTSSGLIAGDVIELPVWDNN